MRHNKNIIVNESVMNAAKGILISESFVPSYQQTLRVKEYLDNNFTKIVLDDIDMNGHPKKIPAVQLMSNGQPLKTFLMPELISYLVDQFQSMIKNENDLKIFLQQVVKDWFMKRIGKDGILSVNHI